MFGLLTEIMVAHVKARCGTLKLVATFTQLLSLHNVLV